MHATHSLAKGDEFMVFHCTTQVFTVQIWRQARYVYESDTKSATPLEGVKQQKQPMSVALQADMKSATDINDSFSHFEVHTHNTMHTL